MKDHIKLDANESNALLDCLLKAEAVGQSTGNLDLVAIARYLADLIIDNGYPKETLMCESSFQVPADYVSTTEQAHAQGLLTIYEAAKLLDMLIPDLAQETGPGGIEVTARFNNIPAFSIQAVADYRRRRYARAG